MNKPLLQDLGYFRYSVGSWGRLKRLGRKSSPFSLGNSLTSRMTLSIKHQEGTV